MAPFGTTLVKMGVVALLVLGATWVLQDDRGVPLAALILLGFVLLFQYVTTRTRFGRHIYAVGGNDEAARRAGIKVDRVRIAVFMIASLDGGDRRHHGRLAPARGQPVLGRQRPAAARDRRSGRRGHEPLRRPRQRLDGAARRAA